ncbi:MAG: DUF4430 domain-containing protein [Emergencia sp.]|nr:DUF4430 domain-containing protein [Emergencia sp.]
MKVMKKKWISILVILAVLFSTLNMSVYAGEAEDSGTSNEAVYQKVSQLIQTTNFGKASCFGTTACFGSVYFRVLKDDHKYYDGAAGIAGYLQDVFVKDEEGKVSVNPASKLREMSYTDALTVINFASAFSSYEEYILRNGQTLSDSLRQQKELAIEYFKTVDNKADGYHTHTASGPFVYPSMGVAVTVLGSLMEQQDTERFEALLQDAYENIDAGFYNSAMYLTPFYQLCAKYPWFDRERIPAVPETLTDSDVLTQYAYGVDLAKDYPEQWNTYVQNALSDDALSAAEAKAFAYHYAYQLTGGDVWLGVYGSSRNIVDFPSSMVHADFDETTGTLNLSGYGILSLDTPSWSEYADHIQSVYVGDGIRSNPENMPVIEEQPSGIVLNQNDAVSSYTLSVKMKTDAAGEAAEGEEAAIADRYAFTWYTNSESTTSGGTVLNEDTRLGESSQNTHEVAVDTSKAGISYYYCHILKMDGQGRVSWTWTEPVAVEIKEAQQPAEPTDPSDTIKVKFSLYGDDEHDSDQCHTMTDGTLKPWVKGKTYTVAAGSTAWDVLQKAAVENGFTLHARNSQYGIYVEGVSYNGVSLYEFSNGSKNSGWLYRINGTQPQVTLENYSLQNGDHLVFHFTDDYAKEEMNIKIDEDSSGGIHYPTLDNPGDDNTDIDEPDTPLDPGTEAVKSMVSSMKLTARSARTSKKNVKVTITTDKATTSAVKELKELGYTVKYTYFRSTKKTSGYKAKLTKSTKTYTNTVGKRGQRYYYRAQIRVYDKDGKLIAKTMLKQCEYANRIWKK